MSASIRVWESGASAFASGYGSRELVRAAGGSPLWSRAEHGWTFAPRRIADVLALAQESGRRVEWLGRRTG